MIRERASSWESTTIGEVVDVFDSIRVPLNSRQRAKRRGKYPYYGASGVIDSVDDFLFNGEYVLVAEDGENLNSRKLPVAFMARGKFWVNNHAHIIKGKPGAADDRFLIAWFANANISEYITGAAQPKLSQANLRRMELRLPSFPLQRKIASILSAYDDLIENNTRRIAILEEMAQAIYREWFVNFRFPGHENVKLVDSPIGQIPEGWEVVELQQLVSFANGKSIKPGGEGEYLVFGSNGTIGGSNEFKYVCGIIIGRVGAYCGSVAYSPKPFWASDNTIIALSQHDDSFIPFVLYMLKDMNLNRYAGGAAQPLLTQTTLKKLPIVAPPNATIEAFCEFVVSLLRQKSCLESKNGNLRTTRDVLLPKLISGKLDVEDLDIDMGMITEALEEATA